MSVSSLAARLPEIATLVAWSRSMAVLDAILSPEWEMRYFSHDAHWAPDEQLASMRNGSGDDYSFTITPNGAYGRGFDHESALTPFARRPPRVRAGLLDAVPDVLRDAVLEPAFTTGDDVPSVTLTVWRLDTDDAWSHGQASDVEPPDDDGGTWLFDVLDGEPETYRAFATEYYEVPVELSAVAHVFAHRRLDDELVRSLNPDLTVTDLLDDLRGIGYPQH